MAAMRLADARIWEAAQGRPTKPAAAWVTTCTALLVLATVAACGGEAPVIGEPPECQSTPPTWARDIGPIAERLCVGCHSEMLVGAQRDGAPAGMDYDRFELFADRAALSAFVDAITSGRQPPPGMNPPLASTSEERGLVSLWRTCGFKP